MENLKTIKIALVISLIALLISIITIIITFSAKTSVDAEIKKETKSEYFDKETSGFSSELGVAYINLDTLLSEYKLAVKLNEELLTEQARARANLQGQMKQFEIDYTNFMEKVQLGSFVSQASMEAQQQELIEKQQRLERLDQELTQGLMHRQEEMNLELYDTIMNFMQEFNKGKYNLILGNTAGSTILYARTGMDITREVIDALNERYDRRMKSK